MLNRTNRDSWPPTARTAPMMSDAPLADDYMVEGSGVAEARPSVAMRIVHWLQMLLILLIAVLTFAVFWLVGLMLNLF